MSIDIDHDGRDDFDPDEWERNHGPYCLLPYHAQALDSALTSGRRWVVYSSLCRQDPARYDALRERASCAFVEAVLLMGEADAAIATAIFRHFCQDAVPSATTILAG